MERLDSILKSVATAAVVQISANIKEEEQEVEEQEEQESEGNPPGGGRRQTLPTLPFKGEEIGHLEILKDFRGIKNGFTYVEETPADGSDKRLQRRERNKQAAARCRKRRLDLTCNLQDEVEAWEERVRSLKEELSELETQKRGLETILRKHSSDCKIVKH